MAFFPRRTCVSALRHVKKELSKCRISSRYSTKIGVSTDESEDLFSNPNFRCSENDPQKHSVDHIDQYYQLDWDVYNRLFKLGGITADFKKLIECFAEPCFMVRKHTLEVIDYLKNANYEDPPMKYCVYGDSGNGKTVSMAHIMHYCDSADWMIVNVPWVPNWTKRIRNLPQSETDPKKFDIHVQAAKWLQHFKIQNRERILKLQLKTSKTYSWSQREETPVGQSWLDILDHGINRLKHSTMCVSVILDELKLHASDKKFKMLVAVDGINSFYDMTTMRKQFRAIVHPDEINLVKIFKDFLASDWKNGALVCSVDCIAGADRRNGIMPRYLLGEEGFSTLEPFVPINVPLFTRKEISSCLDYYIDRNWIQNSKGRTDAGKAELVFLSGYHPHSLMNLCSVL